MRLRETLLPWKSKNKKCCLYKTPYVAAPIWVLGDVIAKFYALCSTSYRRTYKSQNFFWFTSDAILKRHVLSFQDSYVKFLQGDLQAKVIPERTTYCVTWGVPRRVPSSVSASRLHSDLSSWEKSLSNPEEQVDRKKGKLSYQPRLRHVTPTALLGGWVLQPIKGMTSLGTDFEKRAKWQGYIEEATAKDFIAKKVRTLKLTKCKEPAGTQSSAKSAWEVVQKLLSDKQQSTFIHKFGNSLGIPFPSCTALT